MPETASAQCRRRSKSRPDTEAGSFEVADSAAGARGTWRGGWTGGELADPLATEAELENSAGFDFAIADCSRGGAVCDGIEGAE